LVIRSRYAAHADRKTSGVHAGHGGKPTQKPSFTWATMRGPSIPLLSYTVAESHRMVAVATSAQSRW
jgi:hypothetical protein